MTSKEWLGAIAVAIGFAGYYPYFLSVWRRKTYPHAFSWIIWSLLSFITFFAQESRHAGPGAWSTGGTAILCLMVALCGLLRGEKNITRGDWIAFVAALAAIPLWCLTNDPLWAVAWITVIDTVAFYPTVRKSWHKPYEENIWPYTGDAVKYVLALFALQSHSIVTMTTPIFVVVANSMFLAIILWRRNTIK